MPLNECAQWIKTNPNVPHNFFATEAAGLRWLAEPGVIKVVDVQGSDAGRLVLQRLTSAPPTREAARVFGESLARLHASGAPAFGAVPAEVDTYYFGPLEAPMEFAVDTHDSFADFYAEERIRPLMEYCERAGNLDADLAEQLNDFLAALDGYATDVRPARVHGDLWSGNVMWTPRGATLIDPAACGNHPLADLAMLRLFGAPHLDVIEQAYEQTADLPAGWRAEIPIHQLFGLLAHLTLFGRSYAAGVRDALRASREVLT